MHVPRVTCPRCDHALETAELRQVPIQLCASCQGTLVTQLELTPLLEALSAELLRGFDPDARLRR